MTGMHGDGTSDGTQVRFADPAGTAFHDVSFTEFEALLDASDPVAFGIGVLHF